MKKLLPMVKSAASTFVIYFLISIVFNYFLNQTESIGETLFSALIFTVIYHVCMKLFSKRNG